MAPNRKQIDQLLTTNVDLTLLQSTVQPKFLPLTHPKEEEQHLQRQQEEKVQQQQKPQEETASYWDWPADVPKDLFSASHLQSNLVKASEEIIEKEVTVSTTNSENDDYWAEESSTSNQQVVAVAKPQHELACYWDWTSTTKQEQEKATIDSILEEDKARRFVSASLKNVKPTTDVVSNADASNDGYWSWESPVVASHVNGASHPQANYWDWETTTETEKKNTMIEQLKAYEHARQLLTSEHIVELLQKKQQQQPAESVTASAAAKSDEYWTWSEPLGDAYWDESPVAKPAAVTCGGAGYWDW